MSVVIAGAGPTGLVLACALLRRGLRVQIVDSAAGPPITSRAFALQPRGQEVLNRVGALSDLRERGITATTVSLYSGTRPLLSMKLGHHSAGDRSMVLISQAEIETQLRRRLGELGGRVQWGTPVVDATADKGGVSVTFGADRKITRADWLVGCDGAHSVVRKLAGIEFPGTPLIERFLLADVHADLPL
jgi:4,5-epoxidase